MKKFTIYLRFLNPDGTDQVQRWRTAESFPNLTMATMFTIGYIESMNRLIVGKGEIIGFEVTEDC